MDIALKSDALKAATSLRELADAFPKEFPAGFRTLGTSLKSKVQRAMKTGQTPAGPLPPLHPLTKALRRKSKGFGGRLQSAVRYKVRGAGVDSVLSIGFLDGSAANAAKATMEPYGVKLSRAARRRWRIRAAYARKSGDAKKADAIEAWLLAGSFKTKPAREFVNPFCLDKATASDAVRIVKGRIDSIIRKKGTGK